MCTGRYLQACQVCEVSMSNRRRHGSFSGLQCGALPEHLCCSRLQCVLVEGWVGLAVPVLRTSLWGLSVVAVRAVMVCI